MNQQDKKRVKVSFMTELLAGTHSDTGSWVSSASYVFWIFYTYYKSYMDFFHTAFGLFLQSSLLLICTPRNLQDFIISKFFPPLKTEEVGALFLIKSTVILIFLTATSWQSQCHSFYDGSFYQASVLTSLRKAKCLR